MLKSMIVGVSLMCMSAFAMANNKIWSAKDAEAFLESEGIPTNISNTPQSITTTELSNVEAIWKELEKHKTQWNILRCHRDRFEEYRVCSMSKNKVIISIIAGREFVYVGQDHVPYRKSAIKIDNQPTIYGMEGEFTENNKIIRQMLNGQTLYYRYYELPNDYYTEGSIELNDFRKAYEKLWQLYRDIE